MKMDNLFSIYEIANLLNISKNEVFRKRQEMSISPAYKKGNYQYYRLEQFETIEKYYPLKTIETYYIYESKINKLETN